MADSRKTFEVIRTEKDPAARGAKLRALAREETASMSAEELKAVGGADAVVEQALKAIDSPWFLYFIEYDPRPALRKVNVPVLALNGELDLQVIPDQNLPEIEKALREAGNKDVTLRRLPGLNHLFQPATTGAPAEYATIELTMDPAVLDMVTQWIAERFIAAPPKSKI